jgi:hypothetical protein
MRGNGLGNLSRIFTQLFAQLQRGISGIIAKLFIWPRQLNVHINTEHILDGALHQLDYVVFHDP